ncbi:hypothetical protein VSDG_05612 [Cytospora chrysosperma]|uniref:C3H1-type domain-containing protein n=1 Tax=Cytospora chrysosperma TaxID=252740 RepID=A0A423W045_CYTCH|nr:hypothetical protein VSDG_05612 [Valsa sordida]
MSQYPYGYGFPGQQPQQQYPYQPYGSYSAPGYGAQQPQQPQQPPPPAANYYAATQSAYDYNANSIPGLGAPSTAPLFPVPFNGHWDQNGYGTNAPAAQYPPYVPNPTSSTPISYANKQNQAPVLQGPPLPPQYKPNQPKVPAKVQRTERSTEQPRQQLRDVDSQEEGEISDGQFDDLYDDTSNQPPGPQLLTVASASAKSSEDEVTSATDQEPNFYDTDLDDVSAPNNQSTVPLRGKALGSDKASKQAEPARAEHDRSRSYSPYLSPREVEQDISTPAEIAVDTQAGRENKQQLPHRGVNVETNSGGNEDAREQVSGTERGEEGEIVSNGLATTLTSPRSFGTLPEAQNEAKKTILRLLPLGVKYQTYIDEGIDEKVVKDLFTQLNLAPPAPSSAPSDKPSTDQEKENQDPKPQPTEPSEADARAKKQEERKDKIARLLAEKKAKAAAGVNKASKEPVTPIAATTSSPSIKPKTQSEKNLLLQQKMEALRKAQEARAQKASQQSASPQGSKPEVAEKSLSQPPTRGPAVAMQPATGSNSTAAARPSPVALTLSHDGPVASPSQLTPRIQSPALTGLPAKQVNQRKRPVAADFVDYPTQAVKRPFLPTRPDSSLVISVSDDEEDDDDVDMEMDSAAEDSPASAQQSFSLPRKAHSLRDYPPLTNRGAARQLSSPASGTPGGRTANVDLKAQERAIADLKRKIEEAEARKKAKPKTGSSTPQTPSAGDITPVDHGIKTSARRAVSTSEMDDKNGPSAQLLQEAEAAKLPKSPTVPQTERLSRLPSAQIPGAKASVDEKVARIKRMEEELSRLRAEVELAGKQRSEKVEDLDPRSSADPVQDTQSTNAPATLNDEPDRMQSEETSFDAASQSHPMELDSSEKSDDEMDITPKSPQADASEFMDEMDANGHESLSHNPKGVDTVQSSVAEQSAEPPAAVTSGMLSGDVMSAAEEDASDDYEPPDAPNDDRTPADSPPFSPAPANDTGGQGEGSELVSPTPTMPTQISTASMPNDDPATEAHAEFFAHPSSRVEEITREAADDSASTPQTSFVDYESPLRYFRAYRFHPQYNDSVAGGFKSLTYSNRIDPKREVCPDELDGQDCPRGGACQFQHFQAMAAPDNLIILELGSSEDLMGDQKKNFNNGLRELVASFQKSKVRDFKTIAEGIVEFRRRFLGDSTKILHLEGITI